MHFVTNQAVAVEQDATKGAAVYSAPALALYDAFVVGFSNTYAWKCPSRLLLDFYNQNVSADHLDVGVGTGYFLDKCRFPLPSPRLTLVDLNPNCLRTASRRVLRHHPAYELAGCYLANVLEPMDLGDASFGSIGLNYVMHCLPGDMSTKSAAFAHLQPWLKPGGVLFGATILGAGVGHGFLARKLMNVYNAKGIFSNRSDSVEGLRSALDLYFARSSVRMEGGVALFSAQARLGGSQDGAP
jgi:SAM-dependent methyltransferase